MAVGYADPDEDCEDLLGPMATELRQRVRTLGTDEMVAQLHRLLEDRRLAYENLRQVQARCGELLEETRRAEVVYSSQKERARVLWATKIVTAVRVLDLAVHRHIQQLDESHYDLSVIGDELEEAIRPVVAQLLEVWAEIEPH